MRYRFPALIAAWIVFLSASARAQQDELIVFHEPDYPSPHFEYRTLAPDGTVGPAVGWVPGREVPLDMMIAPDNRSLRVLVQELAIYDMPRFGLATTVATGTPIQFGRAMIPRQDDEVLILRPRSLSSTEIVSFANNQFRVLSTVAFWGGTGVGTDPLTGEIIIRSSSPRPTTSAYNFVDPATGATRSVTVPRGAGATRIGYDAETDTFTDLLLDVGTNALSFVRIDRNVGVVQTTPLPTPTMPTWVDMVTASRRGQPTKYWALIRTGQPYGFVLAGLRGDGSLTRAAQVNDQRIRPIVARGESESLVASLDRAPNDRTLRVSFPSLANRPYLVGLSLTGVQSGPTLPDGRRVPISPDALTALSLQGGVPGLLAGTVGTLDARGEAAVSFTLNALGTAPRGVKVWAAAVVLDPAAPSGVGEVSPPKVITLR